MTSNKIVMEDEKESREEHNKNLLLSRIVLGNSDLGLGMRVSYVMGLTLGGAGRVTGEEWIPIIPPMMDIVGWFAGGALIPKNIPIYLAYGAGVATAYADKIYDLL